eukprot:gene14854-10622_t
MSPTEKGTAPVAWRALSFDVDEAAAPRPSPIETAAAADGETAAAPRRLQLALDELRPDEVSSADCRSICALWNEFCCVEGLRSAWTRVLADSDALDGGVSAERRLLALYALTARFFRAFRDRLTLVDGANAADDAEDAAALRLPDSAAFGRLLARALAQCFVAEVAAGADDAPSRSGFRRVFELATAASLRGFLRALLDELRSGAPLDAPLGAACGAALWAQLPSARARAAFLCCAECSGDATPAVVSAIGAFVGALSDQSAALFARCALDACAATSLSSDAAAALAAAASLASYAAVTRLVGRCSARLLREAAAAGSADVEAPLVEGVAAAVEAEPEKLRVALAALRELCDAPTSDAAGRLGERLPQLDGLVRALSTALSPDDAPQAAADAPGDAAQPPPPPPPPQAPRRDVARVVEDGRGAGPDAPQKLSALLAAPDGGFDRRVGDVLCALLTAQNVEALADWDAQLRRLRRLLTRRFPAAVVGGLCDALLAAAPSDGGFEALDVAFCSKLLVAVEDAVADLDAAPPTARAAPREKTRVKAPLRLALSASRAAPQTQAPTAAYVALTDDVPARLLPALWRVLQRCRPPPAARPAAAAAAAGRSYLICEVGAAAAPADAPAADGVDFARALLTAQALHAQAAALLSLSRSRSTLPALVVLVLDDLAPAPSLWSAVPLRRAACGAVLTAAERLSRAAGAEDAPDAQTLQRVLAFLDRAEEREQDELCRRMLLQTMAMLVGPL